jgi:hypothetical protein
MGYDRNQSRNGSKAAPIVKNGEDLTTTARLGAIMATHRPHDTAFAPDFDFQVTLGVLEAFENLAARRRPITLDTLAHQLQSKPCAVRPTVTQIERGLTQVQYWRTQILTRDILHHRGQLVALSAQLRAKRRRLDEDQLYLDKMLRDADALLQNTLTALGGEKPLPAQRG